MTECEEVAGSLRTAWEICQRHNKHWPKNNLDHARDFVKRQMKGESEQFYDNVAEALVRG